MFNLNLGSGCVARLFGFNQALPQQPCECKTMANMLLSWTGGFQCLNMMVFSLRGGDELKPEHDKISGFLYLRAKRKMFLYRIV